MTEQELLAQFGIATIGPSGGKNLWFVKEGEDNIYRIFPPMKDQASTGRYAFFHGMHWGFKGVDKFTNKEVHRRFRCVRQKNKDKSIKVECAECTEIDAKKALLERSEAAFKAEGKTEKEIEGLLEPINDWLKVHNVDKKFYLHVMNQKGEYGDLAIAYTQFGNLEEVIKAFKAENPDVDPIGVKTGVWFNFRKSGKGRDTKHPVSILTQKVEAEVNGKKKMLDETVEAPLSVEQLTKALATFQDLSTIVRVLTPDQIHQLVETGGDPEKVEAIFNAGSESPVTPKALRDSPAKAGDQVGADVAPVEAKSETKPVSTISNADFIARYGKKV